MPRFFVFRGLAIEFPSHQENLVWRQFWDAIFSIASVLLAIVFGTTLGNLVRGVPLDADGLKGMPLFTDLLIGSQPGIFDWYTILVGIFTLFVLAGHGALFLVWRTTGPVQSRSRECAKRAWRVVMVLWMIVTIATFWVQREVFINIALRPLTYLFVVQAFGGAWGVFRFLRLQKELPAFLSSSAFLFGLIGATMGGNYPCWLRSTIDPAFNLTAQNTASSSYGLSLALCWWTIGMALAFVYFAYLYLSIREKVDADNVPLRH